MSVFPALRAFTRPAPLRGGLVGLIGICVWAVAVGSAVSSAVAQPMPHVVLVQPEGEEPRPGLEPSLRIQLRDGAELSSQTAQWPADLPARIEAANRLAEATGADWVVWAGAPRLVHEATSEAELESENAVLYLVGRRDGRALIEVVRVPAGQGPEVDRSLALKVHELIGVRDGAAYALGNAELPAPQPGGSAPPDKNTQKVELWLEAGAQLGSAGNAGFTADLLIALGPCLVTDSFTLAVPIELSLGLPRSVERSAGEVEWSELSAAALVRLMLPVSSALMLGAGAGGKLAFIDATGTAPSGATGSSTDNLPALFASFDAELKLASALGMRVSLGLEQRLRRQHLLIEGREIANTGRTVPFGRISFVWHAF